ncbi:MAG: hypothetical protein AAB263_02780 [Planctomycetota bacterium]
MSKVLWAVVGLLADLPDGFVAFAATQGKQIVADKTVLWAEV